MAAGGMTDFRKRYPEKKLEELVMEAVKMAFEDPRLKKSPQEIREMVNFCCYGEFADHFQDQLLCEAKVHDYLGFDPLFNLGIKTGGATGGSTILTAAAMIASGQADVALAAGWERMDEVDTWTGNYYISTAACKDFETRLARIYASYYAPMARRFQQVYQLDEKVRAAVAVKNRGYAYNSPFAQQGGKHTIEEVLAGEIVCDPLRMLECCAMSVGSAAVIICDEKTAYELTDNPVRIYIAGGSHTLRVSDRRDMEIPLLPHEDAATYEKLYKHMKSSDSRWPGFESFLAARFASWLVYRMAGIKNPIEDIDLVELHDAFTISDIQTYGDIGLTLYGEEPTYITSGDAYHGGRCPANLSGGLLGTMHAVGATGIFSAIELLWQIQNRYDEFHGSDRMWKKYGKTKPADWKSLQVPNAKKGLWVSHAGVGSHVTVGILEKAW